MSPAWRAPRLSQLTVRGWQAVLLSSMGVMVLAGAVVGALLLHRTDEMSRGLIDDVQPARMAAFRLQSAVRDQETGIRGYLMLNTSPTLLGWAILAARAGRTVVDPQIRRIEPSAVPAGKPFAPEVPLTRREQDVLDELLQGQSNRQIGRNLFISEDTVKSHVKAILRKLGARDRAHAVSLVLSSRNGGGACTCGAHGLSQAAVPADADL